jgi:hypothetical protein
MKGAELMAQKVVDNREETPEEAKIRRETVCRACKFHDNHSMVCNYYSDTGKLRKCAPSRCMELGIWQAGKRRKAPTQISLVPKSPVFIP